ncbi:MAG: hypothetical protein ACYDA4_15070 [Ignavibacteriaceae bacterium]
MKNYIYIFSIIMFIYFNGCFRDDNPVATNNDEFLKSKLVGRWGGDSNSTYVAYYYNNNTFIDSLYDLTNLKRLQYAITGKYSINESIITFSDLKCTYADTINIAPNVSSDNLVFYPEKMEYSDSILKYTNVEIFSQERGDKNQLKGKWSSELWIIGIERRPMLAIVQGTINNSYYFYPDSLFYQLDVTNSFGSTYSYAEAKDSGSYDYSPPSLELNSFYFWIRFYSIKVSFNNNKMYFHYNWSGSSENSINKIGGTNNNFIHLIKILEPLPICRDVFIKRN